MDEALKFFEALFGYKPPEAYILIFTLPDRQSYWTQSIEQAAEQAMANRDTQNVYFGVGLSPQAFGRKNRCAAADVIGIPGFWADFDLLGPAHKKPNLPETRADIDEILVACGLHPSLLVDSGHGIQAYWLFKEPWLFDGSEERFMAAAAAENWLRTLRLHSRRRGWDLDATHDLARVMRVPGTLNRKGDGPPREVRML